jgi:cell division protein FtsB
MVEKLEKYKEILTTLRGESVVADYVNLKEEKGDLLTELVQLKERVEVLEDIEKGDKLNINSLSEKVQSLEGQVDALKKEVELLTETKKMSSVAQEPKSKKTSDYKRLRNMLQTSKRVEVVSDESLSSYKTISYSKRGDYNRSPLKKSRSLLSSKKASLSKKSSSSSKSE